MPKLKLEYQSLRIKLRPLELSDEEDIYKHVRFREVSKWTKNIPYPYPKNGAKTFIKESRQKLKEGMSYNFAIRLREKNETVGVIGLTSIDKKNNAAELGYWLSKDYWGKGIMSEAVKLVLEFAFLGLKLHRIRSQVIAPNEKSSKVLLGAGFSKEGTLRDASFKYQEYHNMYVFGLLRNEWVN